MVSKVVRNVVQCTPEVYFGPRMQNYITEQCQLPKNNWIYEIIDGTREQDNVVLNDPEFIMLPDIDNHTQVFNYLVIFKDRSLKTIRDLKASHLPLLKRVRESITRLLLSSGCPHNQLMLYFHYLPSVYQLHLHIVAPYGRYTTQDPCKIHSLQNVISNLELHESYYQKIELTTVIVSNVDLIRIYLPYMNSIAISTRDEAPSSS